MVTDKNQDKERIRKSEAARKEKNEYLERKAKMLKYEKQNYSAIVFFRGVDGYYIAGGHSAVILYNLVAPEVGMKIAIRKDQDFGDKFPEGVMAIRSLKKYKELILRSKEIRGVEENDLRICFRLKTRLNKEAYNVLASSEEIKREELVNMASSSRVMPKSYQRLREVVRSTFKAVNVDSAKIARELLTHRLMNGARAAMLLFLKGAKGEIEIETALDDVNGMLKQMLRELVVIEAAGVWHVTECRKIAFNINRALTEISTERKTLG